MTFMTAIMMYANDLLLVSITLQDLHKMLDIVCAELSWLDMVLNVKKSGLMRIGQRFNVDFSPVLVCGVMLPVVEKISYLGVDVSSGRSLGLCMHSRRMKFFRAFNALYAKLGGVASDIVILHLTHTFCLPILLYGLESFTVLRSCLNAIEFCWNRAMFKIFNTGSCDNVNYVLYYTGILPLSYQIDRRKLRYYQSVPSVGGTDH